MDEILKYRNIIIAVILIAVFVTLNYSIFSHYTEELAKLDQRTKELEDGRETLKRWEVVKKDRKEIAKMFLSGDTSVLKTFIEESARENNIMINSVNVSRQDKDYYWIAELVLEARGYYRDFVEFISLMESRKVSIDTLSVLSGSRDEDDAELVIRCALSGVVIE